jgi:hypothetical protein
MIKFKNVLCFETQFMTFNQIGLQKTPLLTRRGAETDERSESDEAGWWNSHFIYVPFWIFFPLAFLEIYLHHPGTNPTAPSVRPTSCHPSWPGGELYEPI